MKIKWKRLLLCLAIPLAVGGISSLLSEDMAAFQQLRRPPLSPPGWIFPIVWTILYLFMGLASYLIAVSEKPRRMVIGALGIYGAQLAVNLLWPVFFFRFQWYLFSFLWILLLWGLIFITAIRFYRLEKPAGALLLPYVLWVSFAGYLNFAVYLLN